MIILNTLNAAVTEYDLTAQSITPTHMGDAAGLYAFGGDLDATAPIVAEVLTGDTLWDSSVKKQLSMVYFSLRGEGDGEAIIKGRKDEYRYAFPVQASGQSRAMPGKGIRENYLAFGYSNAGGDNFQLDRIEVLVASSKTRRVGS